MYNEQALNRGDVEYNPYNDYGSYFTGFDYMYQGQYHTRDSFDVGDAAWTIADTSLFLLGVFTPIGTAANTVKTIGTVYTVASIGKGWASVGSNAFKSLVSGLAPTEKTITTTSYYQNRDDQLAHYKDLDDNPVLVKNALCLVDTDDDQSMWYGVGDNVTAYFYIGHSALNGKTSCYTRFIDQLGLQIVHKKFGAVAAGDTIIQDTLRTPETKEADFMETSSVYMMPEGQDHFVYDNIPYGGNYNVNVNLSSSATVTVNGVTQTGSNLSFDTFINVGEDISIDLSGNEVGLTGSVYISLNDGLTVNSILPGDKYLLKTDLEDVKTLTTGNQNLIIENIYLYDNGFKPYRSYMDFSEGASVTYPFESGRDYYIMLRNDGTASISGITLSVNELRTVPVDEDVTISVDTEAFAFVNTDMDEMSFQFTIPKSSDGSLTIYNQNGNAIGVSTILTTGDIKSSLTLGAGEKAYFFCSLNTSLSLKITTDLTYLKWEIDGTVREGYTFTLPRGTSYNLRLLYVKDGVMRELESGYRLYKKENYYTFDGHTLTMTYAVPYEYIITLISLKYPDASLRIIPTLGREDIEYTVTLDKNYGSGGPDSVIANYNKNMPEASAPTRTGYIFIGYFSERYNGEQYYDANMQSVKKWDIEEDTTLYARWEANKYTVTFLQGGGSGGTTSVVATYDEALPWVTLPLYSGYNFLGYYTLGGTCYYDYFDADAYGENYYYYHYAHVCDFTKDITLYARWEEMTWDIYVRGYLSDRGMAYFEDSDDYPTHFTLSHNEEKVYYVPGILDYNFSKWTLTYAQGTIATGTGKTIELTNLCKGNYDTYTLTFYYTYNPNRYTAYGMELIMLSKTDGVWKFKLTNNTGASRTFQYNAKMCFESDAENWKGLDDLKSITLSSGGSSSISISENAMATSIAVSYIDGIYRKVLYAKNLNESKHTMTAMSNLIDTTQEDECLAAGTLITLADGSQVPVENLTGNEMLLVWNMQTGKFESVPILFIDSDPLCTYEIINLSFSDGTSVKVINEHGFWDFDLNKYIYLDKNAGEYIGHWFNKLTTGENGTFDWTRVRLNDVTISNERTTAYSPVTYGHLCYYVNGMLSMPGGIDGFMNIFEVDGETMTVNQTAYLTDIEEYGLFTYEEFYKLYQIPEEIFNAFNGQYLKIALGKGLVTYEEIGDLIERYNEFF